MTIEEYLLLTRKRTGGTSHIEETEAFYEQLQNIVDESGITDAYLIITNTCKAECSTVYLDNKKYIIWDSSYWNYIENYLSTIEIHLDGECSSSYELYNYLLYQMLRYKVNDKIAREALFELERRIATNLRGNIPKNTNKKHNTKVFLEFLKLFAFIHELFHIKFKENNEMRLSALKEFDEYIQLINEEKNLWFSNKSAYSDIDFTEKINIDEAIKQYANNDNVKIEVMCDYYALDSLAESFEHLAEVLDMTKESFLADICCLKESIIGFYNDVLYYQEYIERLSEYKTAINDDIIIAASKGFYDIANLYMARESLFNPLFLMRCFKKHNCVVLTHLSSYYDIYNKLNHKSLRNSYLKNFIDFYNALV